MKPKARANVKKVAAAEAAARKDSKAAAQAMAQQGSLDAQKAAVSIGKQESANQMKAAQGDMTVQSMELQGAQQARAAELDKLLQPLHSSLFIESNPSPVKYAASLLGMCKPTVRLPLVEIREETKKKVSEALKVAKLL